MSKFVIEVPERFVEPLGLDSEHAPDDLRLVIAMQFYGQRKLSAGAAEFAGVSVPEFLVRRGEFDLPPYHLSMEELQAELEVMADIRLKP